MGPQPTTEDQLDQLKIWCDEGTCGPCDADRDRTTGAKIAKDLLGTTPKIPLSAIKALFDTEINPVHVLSVWILESDLNLQGAPFTPSRVIFTMGNVDADGRFVTVESLEDPEAGLVIETYEIIRDIDPEA